jgi:predicted DNA-binding protein (MmcQ/YjbR family)
MSISLEVIRSHCLRKKGKITEELPFDEDTLVFKVHGKIFLLTSLTAIPVTLNLKCDPGLALELRERHEAVQAGYHMNKRHWITVTLDGSIGGREIFDMIDHSYQQVVKGLPRRIHVRLQEEGKE